MVTGDELRQGICRPFVTSAVPGGGRNLALRARRLLAVSAASFGLGSGVASATSIQLGVGQQLDGLGRSVVAVTLKTDSNPGGRDEGVVVFAVAGSAHCPADPRRRTSGSAELAFRWNGTLARWEPRKLQFIPDRVPRKLVICGYAVLEAPSSGGFAVLAKAHSSLVVKAWRRDAPSPGSGAWRSCSGGLSRQLLALATRPSGPSCANAKETYNAWKVLAVGATPRLFDYRRAYSNVVVSGSVIRCQEKRDESAAHKPIDVVCGSVKFRYRTNASF